MNDQPNEYNLVHLHWFFHYFFSRLLFYFICISRAQDKVEVHKNAPPPPPQPHEKNVFTKGKHSATQPEVESFLHLLGLGERFYLSWVRSLLSMRCMLGYSFKPRPNSSALGKVPRLWPSVLSKECFHSRGPHLCKFLETKESVCIRKEYNSQRIGLGHQHGRRFIVLGHQYGRRDVMWKHSINRFSPLEKPVLPEKTRLTSPEVQAAATSKAWRDSGGAS